MNNYMEEALQRCVENELRKHTQVEFIVRKLKPVWPEANGRRELWHRITTFAEKNGWIAEVREIGFRVWFVKA